MPQLLLLRHAKSSWELGGDLDWERGLTERGADDLKLVTTYMAGRGLAPDLILCSTARRARESLKGIATVLPPGAIAEFTDAIYQATAVELLGLLQSVGGEPNSVLMVGHNPSMHDLAVDLADGTGDLSGMAGKFPTAALAEFEFGGPWDKLDSGGAALTAFTRPKQLR
jgi:phosphohistidine phosphatase